MTQHPDEGTLHAYIDGELSSAEAKALEAHVAGCAGCSAALAEARGLVAATSQVITALDAAPAVAHHGAGVVGRPGATPAPARPARPVIFRMPYARAAALLLLVGGSAFVADRSGVFDGSSRSRPLSMPADVVQRSEPLVEAAPEAAASAASAPAPAAPATPADLSGAAVGSTSGAAARKEASAPAVVPAAPPMAPPPPARAVDGQASELMVTGTMTPGPRISRYRTADGTILTLTEETLRTSFTEESDARRTAAPVAAGAQRSAVAPMPALVMNSYRWSSQEQGRTYTLTGPLPVAELEALSRRLTELERLP